jgi:hypothetical protein
MRFGKREDVLIKDHIPRNIDTTGGDIKIFESFVHVTIPREHTLLGTELKLSLVIGAKIRPTCAPRDSKKGIIRLNLI